MKNALRLDAKDIAEALLELTGSAIMERKFEQFATAFQLPQRVVTIGDIIDIDTPEALRRAFESQCDHYRAIGVTRLCRFVAEAEYTSPTTIISTHVAQLFRDDTPLQDAYPVYSQIGNVDGTWRILSSEYAIEPSSGQAAALALAKSQLDDRCSLQTDPYTTH